MLLYDIIKVINRNKSVDMSTTTANEAENPLSITFS